MTRRMVEMQTMIKPKFRMNYDTRECLHLHWCGCVIYIVISLRKIRLPIISMTHSGEHRLQNNSDLTNREIRRENQC